MKQREHVASEQESQMKLVYAGYPGRAEGDRRASASRSRTSSPPPTSKLADLEQNRIRLETERQQHADAVKKSASGDEASPAAAGEH